MADSNDQAVDRAIRRLQDVLDDLKAAQSKDDAEEGDYASPASDLKEAAGKARRMFTERRKSGAGK